MHPLKIHLCSSKEQIEKNRKLLPSFFSPFVKEDLQFCKTSLGEWNLCDEEKRSLHSPKGALKECQNLLSDTDVDIFCVYGIGLGYFFLLLEKWLKEKKERRLFIFEEDSRVLEKIAHTNIAERFFKNKRVEIFQGNTFLDWELSLKKAAWKGVLRKVRWIALPSYEARKKDFFSFLSLHFEEWQKGAELLLVHGSDLGISVTENLYTHYQKIPSFRLFEELKGSFSKIPAILCGAAPSLEKNLPKLKELRQNALIFAGGSAINALTDQGIFPHFAASNDPDAPWERFQLAPIWEIPFFYSSFLSKKILPWIPSERFLVAQYEGDFLSKWFSEKFGLFQEEVDGGWCVMNFLISLAHLLGCDPIFLVGFDLSFSKGKRYASGVKGGRQKEEAYSLIETEDVHGNKVFTQKDWKMAALWTEKFASFHKEVHLFQINERGLPLAHVARISLREAQERYLHHSWDLDGKVFSSLQKTSLNRPSKAKVQKFMGEVKKSLFSCEKLCNELLEKDLASFLSCQKTLEEVLEGELFFSLLLKPLWSIWGHVFSREIEEAALSEEGHAKLHQLLFFQKVLKEHKALLEKQ